MNRRDFIKSLLAAAVASQVPFTESEAEKAYEVFADSGIEDAGNGWYRCWMTVKKETSATFVDADGWLKPAGGSETFSAYMKAGKSDKVSLQYGKVRAYFDLRTGALGSVDVVSEHGRQQFPEHDLSIDSEDPVYGVQLEVVPARQQYVRSFAF